MEKDTPVRVAIVRLGNVGPDFRIRGNQPLVMMYFPSSTYHAARQYLPGD